MIKYYFFIDGDTKSATYNKPLSVHRLRREKGRAYPETWNGKEWVNNPDVISSSGMGGDNPYEEITEAEAMAFLASHTEQRLYDKRRKRLKDLYFEG